MAAEQITVEVAYARPEQQVIIAVALPVSATALTAITASGILDSHPEIDLAKQTIGIFSQPCNLDTVLHDRDRVEIYRPLSIDPMAARLARAKQSV